MHCGKSRYELDRELIFKFIGAYKELYGEAPGFREMRAWLRIRPANLLMYLQDMTEDRILKPRRILQKDGMKTIYNIAPELGNML